MRYLNSILKFCIIFFAIATVFTACIKDEAPDILDSIAGNYECHLSRIILNDSIEIDPNCMHLGYLSCRAFNIKIIGSGNNYTLNFDSIKINPRTKPDTMLIFNFPSVNVDIVEQGKFEIGNIAAFFKVIKNDYFDSAEISNQHNYTNCFDFQDWDDDMYLNLWLQKTTNDSLMIFSIFGDKTGNELL